MKRCAILIFLAIALPTFAQDVVSEAKANIESKHHKSMVEKAEKLLQQKKDFEAKLATIERQLAQLAEGKDVKVDDDSNVGIVGFTATSTLCCGTSSCGCWLK